MHFKALSSHIRRDKATLYGKGWELVILPDLVSIHTVLTVHLFNFAWLVHHTTRMRPSRQSLTQCDTVAFSLLLRSCVAIINALLGCISKGAAFILDAHLLRAAAAANGQSTLRFDDWASGSAAPSGESKHRQTVGSGPSSIQE
eukprot:6193726-Pleurochrysis_carterae.AAC.3